MGGLSGDGESKLDPAPDMESQVRRYLDGQDEPYSKLGVEGIFKVHPARERDDLSQPLRMEVVEGRYGDAVLRALHQEEFYPASERGKSLANRDPKTERIGTIEEVRTKSLQESETIDGILESL